MTATGHLARPQQPADGSPRSATGPDQTPGSRAGVALAVAVLAGIAGFAAHPPVDLWWLAFLVVPGLLVATALVGDRPGQVVAVGVVGGLATFLPLLSWITASPAGYAAWLLLSLVMAAWYAVFTTSVRRWLASPWLLVIAPLLWTGVEAWRSSIPWGGFGWGTLAYAHVDGSPWLPLARVVGGAGLSLLTAVAGTALFVAARALSGARRRWAVAGVLVAVAVAVPPAVWTPAAPPATGDELDVLVVQGNDLAHGDARGADEDLRIAVNLLDETRAAVGDGRPPELTIWPESAIDRDPLTSRGSDLLPVLLAAADVVNGQLLAGAILDGPDADDTFRNTALFVDADGEVVDRYVKRHYVPFGERVPLRSVIGGLPVIQRYVPRDGVPAQGAHAIDAAATDLAVIICFETLFPSIVRSNLLAGEGSGLLVAITNDASFGRTAESDQHVAQTRLRAVETGRWTVHAALSGGSAIIDPDGRVVAETGLFEVAHLRRSLPLVTATTPFLRAGDVVGTVTRWGSLVLVVATAVVVPWWRRRRGRGTVSA